MADTMLGMDHDSLHLLVGTLGFLLVVIVLRRDCRSLLAWLLILLLELANEAHDVLVDPWPSLAQQVGEGAKDIGTTMVIPTVLLLLARFAPATLVGARAKEAPPSETD